MVYRLVGKASRSEGSFAFWPMLVRRIATVTISAPLASTARRVSSKSRYFPVPISRRERYVLPAIVSASAPVCSVSLVGAFTSSAASHGDDDLQRVAVGESRPRVAAARHDLAVLFHGDAFSRQFERLDQSRKVGAGFQAPDLAVDGELDHFEIGVRGVKIILTCGCSSMVERKLPKL